MMIADYLLAWSIVAVAIYFGARLLTSPSEERFARGLFAATRRD